MSASQKPLINDPATLVLDGLKGLCMLNPDVTLDERHKVIYRRQIPHDEVAIISGGGSGHEPAHAGFVGDGMLTAAVCGNIFASPNAGQVKAALDIVRNRRGTLMIVKNYTGDVLNFGLASEQFKASSSTADLADIRMIVVGDDVAVGKTQGGLVGRRGLTGTILVYKIASALARSGADLGEVESIAKQVACSVGTVGVGLEHCHVPGSEPSQSYLALDEIELGMGIHNEPGHRRVKPFQSLNNVVDEMLKLITSTTDSERSFLPFKGNDADEVVLLVNNLGGTSELEIGAVAGAAVEWLQRHNIRIRRILVGTYMTSLNMPGFSLTLLLLPCPKDSPTFHCEKILSLLDAGVDAPGWKQSSHKNVTPTSEPSKAERGKAESIEQTLMSVPEPNIVIGAITRACNAVIGAEPEITRQDQISGDGDAGTTLKSGALGVLQAIKDQKLDGKDLIHSMKVVSEVADVSMGGTSGALYSIFFSGVTTALKREAARSVGIDDSMWARVCAEAFETLMKYTKARPPSRTLVDPLDAFVKALPSGLAEAAVAARQAAEATAALPALAGRASYMDQERLKEANVPDPGAWGISVIVQALADSK